MQEQNTQKLHWGAEARFYLHFFSFLVNSIKFFFNFPQYLPLKILLATVLTLLTWNVVHDKKLVVMPVNILHRVLFKVLISTKMTNFAHDYPRS